MSDLVTVRNGTIGRGIHTARALRPGERILHFEGPVLSHAEILAFGEAQAYALQIGPDEYIDTRAPGRFTNHSCEPNAGVLNDWILVALHPIAAGEEIRFDYSTTMSEDHWTMGCRCGTSSCRSVIGDFHLLPPELQLRYLDRGIVQRFIVREWECHQARSRLRRA